MTRPTFLSLITRLNRRIWLIMAMATLWIPRDDDCTMEKDNARRKGKINYGGNDHDKRLSNFGH